MFCPSSLEPLTLSLFICPNPSSTSGAFNPLTELLAVQVFVTSPIALPKHRDLSPTLGVDMFVWPLPLPCPTLKTQQQKCLCKTDPIQIVVNICQWSCIDDAFHFQQQGSQSFKTWATLPDHFLQSTIHCLDKAFPETTPTLSQGLRVKVKKYRESADRSEITYFFLFGQKNPFGVLFVEMTSKGSISISFLQNLQNLKIRPQGLQWQP